MRAIIFGDELGLEVFEKTIIPKWNICAIVSARNRESAIVRAKELSKKYNIPHLIQPLIRQKNQFSEFYQKLKDYKPRLFLVNSYSQILSKELLDIPEIGCFNVHAGILPEYRGTNIINWVLINGEKETGVTLHKMTEVIDGGPILLLKKLKIDFEDTANSLREKLKILAQQVIEESIPLFEKSNIELRQQDESRAKYWPKRKPEDGFFSWDWDEIKIYNLIRALVAPWPGAFTFLNGRKKIYNKFLTLDEIRKIKNEKNRGYTSTKLFPLVGLF